MQKDRRHKYKLTGFEDRHFKRLVALTYLSCLRKIKYHPLPRFSNFFLFCLVCFLSVCDFAIGLWTWRKPTKTSVVDSYEIGRQMSERKRDLGGGWYARWYQGVFGDGREPEGLWLSSEVDTRPDGRSASRCAQIFGPGPEPRTLSPKGDGNL